MTVFQMCASACTNNGCANPADTAFRIDVRTSVRE